MECFSAGLSSAGSQLLAPPANLLLPARVLGAPPPKPPRLLTAPSQPIGSAATVSRAVAARKLFSSCSRADARLKSPHSSKGSYVCPTLNDASYLLNFKCGATLATLVNTHAFKVSLKVGHTQLPSRTVLRFQRAAAREQLLKSFRAATARETVAAEPIGCSAGSPAALGSTLAELRWLAVRGLRPLKPHLRGFHPLKNPPYFRGGCRKPGFLAKTGLLLTKVGVFHDLEVVL